MSGTGASLSDKIDLAPWGYAPGTSIVSCADCARLKPDPEEAVFIGHRYSHRCAEHALTARQSCIRIHEGELVPESNPPLDQVIKDRWIRRAIGQLILAPLLVAAILLI